jgi:ADP-heptose:LPS heptosyltransferase
VSWTGIARRAAALRGRRFDLVIDLTGTRYSALFAFLLRPGWTLGVAGGELGWLLSASVPDDPRARWHLRERPFHVTRRLLPEAPLPPAIIPPQPALSFAGACASLGLDPDRPVVVLVPGAGWPEKQWPLEGFVEIGRQIAAIGAQIVVIGSAVERPLCERLRFALPDGAAIVLAGAPLGEVCGLLSGATAVIGHDSGIVHLAAAYGRRALALFTGATDPARSRPFGEFGVALRPEDPGADPAAIARWALEESPVFRTPGKEEQPW